MRLEDYPDKDGKKVWLDRSELGRLFGEADDTETTIAFSLMARCGLRSDEVVNVEPADVIDTDVGPRVRVWESKSDRHREIPVPGNLKTTVDTYAELRDGSGPLVDRATRTLQRWVTRAGATLHEETGDIGWTFVRPHDLRRTWGTLLVEAGVEPGMIMSWGGWSDWETFREHYLGAYSPEMERRQAALVPWLDARREDTGTRDANRGGSTGESGAQRSFSERYR